MGGHRRRRGSNVTSEWPWIYSAVYTATASPGLATVRVRSAPTLLLPGHSDQCRRVGAGIHAAICDDSYSFRGEHRQRAGTHAPYISYMRIENDDALIGESMTATLSAGVFYPQLSPILTVTMQIHSDNGVTPLYQLSLISGSAFGGTWQGSWVVTDTHCAEYSADISAQSENGTFMLAESGCTTRVARERAEMEGR